MDVKRSLRVFSSRLLFAVCVLNIIGILMINSATDQNMGYVGRQAVGVVLGVVIIALLCFVSYQELLRYVVPVFVLRAILFLMVRFFGKSVNGAKQWIVLPALRQVQPSELAKTSVTTFFPWLLDKNYEGISQLRSSLLFAASAIIPIGLISAESDLSTIIVVAISIATTLFAAGISYRWIGLALLVAMLFIVSIVFLLKRGMVPFLKEHQVRCILAFLYPAQYADTNWQQDNPITATESGQLFGKGLNDDTLASMKSDNFFPEERTDFTSVVTGEETGFMDCLLVLLLYTTLVHECYYLADKTHDVEGRILCIDVDTLIALQGFSNIATVMGIFPNTGLTSPFTNYGISSLLVFYAQTGLVLGIGL